MQSFQGRFNDGRVARRHAVSVTVRPAGLEIRDENGGLLAVWPLEEVHLTDRVHGAEEARLRRGFEDPARLVVTGAAALSALNAACPNLHKTEQSGWRYWRNAGLWGVAAVFSVVLLFTVVIPALATHVAGAFPESWDARLGREVRAQVIASFGRGRGPDTAGIVCDGQEGLRTLEGLLERLLAGVGDRPEIVLTVIDVDAVNALALPGGQVMVFRGLIDRVRDPNALAGVLAHELGHVLERHPLEVAIEGTASAVVVGLLVGDAFGVAAVGELLLGTAYSREAEAEADAIGLELMARAGIDARPLGPFLLTLGGARGGPVLELFSTHPLSEDRARAIERGAAPGGPAMADAEWQAVRRVCAQVRPAEAG